jgi:hypothetical protein
MTMYACDVYRDELRAQMGHGRGALLAAPIEDAYAVRRAAAAREGEAAGGLFPTDEPLALGGRRVLSAALEPTDVAFGW